MDIMVIKYFSDCFTPIYSDIEEEPPYIGIGLLGQPPILASEEKDNIIFVQGDDTYPPRTGLRITFPSSCRVQPCATPETRHGNSRINASYTPIYEDIG